VFEKEKTRTTKSKMPTSDSQKGKPKAIHWQSGLVPLVQKV